MYGLGAAEDRVKQAIQPGVGDGSSQEWYPEGREVRGRGAKNKLGRDRAVKGETHLILQGQN